MTTTLLALATLVASAAPSLASETPDPASASVRAAEARDALATELSAYTAAEGALATAVEARERADAALESARESEEGARLDSGALARRAYREGGSGIPEVARVLLSPDPDEALARGELLLRTGGVTSGNYVRAVRTTEEVAALAVEAAAAEERTRAEESEMQGRVAALRTASEEASAAEALALAAASAATTPLATASPLLSAVSSGSVSPTSSWGGYANGLIPAASLCPLSVGGSLRCDAAVSLDALAVAYEADFGDPLCLTDSYRSLEEQVSVRARKPGLAAVPGTSEHGWGLAVDLGCGVEDFGTPENTWLLANGPAYGWSSPSWARPGGSKPEAWHFEFVGVPAPTP